MIPLSNFMEGGLQGGARRPGAAQAGVARGEWSWGKGRGRARAPTSALGLSREAAERASHGSRHGGRSGFAAAALLRRGGGRAVVEVVVELGKRRGGLFIGRVRRWGERWGGGRGVVGRRASRAPLMAFGRLRASQSGARAARPAQDDKTAREGARGGGPAAVHEQCGSAARRGTGRRWRY